MTAANPVGDDPVDLVRGGQAGAALFHAVVHDLGDVGVPLVGDDGLAVVVHGVLTALDEGLQPGGEVGGEGEAGHDLLIPLKELDGVPPGGLGGDHVLHQLGDGGEGLLHRLGEGMPGDKGLLGQGQGGGLFGGGHAARPLDGGGLHHRAAQSGRKLVGVDPVPPLFDHVDHVEGHHHRDAQLQQLGGEVEVALDVGGVHQVEDDVGAVVGQVVPGHHLLQGVGGQGVDAGQVHDGHVLAALEPALLLLHGDARPVAHELGGAGEGVEHGGLAAVGIAGKGNGDRHIVRFLLCGSIPLTISVFEGGLSLANSITKGKGGLPPASVRSLHLDALGVALADGQLVPADGDLHRVSQGGDLPDIDGSALGDAHVHDAPAQGALPVEPGDEHGLADLDVLQSHVVSSSLLTP